jgi:tetratricopeptide (TPR) repeat protein
MPLHRIAEASLRPRFALPALFLVALTLRLLYQGQMAASPLWTHLILDEAYNDAWARRGFLADLPFFRAPLYPWLLGALYRLGGPSPEAARVVQAVLSALSCLLIYGLGRRTFGPAAGLGAGLLAATYWPWIYFDGELQDVSLSLFLNLGALSLLLRWRPGASPGWPLAAGVVLGLSAITRPTVLVVLPVAMVWLFWPARGMGGAERPARLVAVGLLAVGTALAIGPVTWMNRVGGGDRVLIAAQGGVNFYIGNHRGSDGHSARFPGARADWWSLVEESSRQAERARGRTLRPSEVSSHWYREGLRFWLQEPGAAIRLALRKAGYLLGAPERANNKQIRFFIERYAPLLLLPWPGYGLVLPLALAGLLWGRGGRAAALLGGMAALYGAAVVAFFVTARFRMPVAAVLCILAGGGLVALWRIAARGSRRRRVVALAVLVPVALAVQWPARSHRENRAHAFYSLGNAYRAADDAGRAEQEYRQALREDPDLPELALSLGALLLDSGRAAEAEALLRSALGRDPSDFRVRTNLALTLQALGRTGEALHLLEEGVRDDPRRADLWVQLGNARAAAGQPGAGQAFLRALELEPGRADARYNLGNARMAQGALEEAAAEFRTLLEVAPEHAGAWNNLGIVLSRLGDPAGSADAFAGAVALEPQRPEAHLNHGQALLAAGRVQAGREALRRALALAPAGGEVESRAREALALSGSDRRD